MSVTASSSNPDRPIVHKTTASGHTLSLKIPEGGGSGGALTSKDEHPRIWGMQLRYVSLVTLALQNASLTIIMHYSRISVAPTEQYSAATAVLMNELLKGSISLLIALKRIDEDMTASEQSAAVRRGSFTAISPASLYATEKEQDIASPNGKQSKSFFPSLASIKSGAALATSSSAGSSSNSTLSSSSNPLSNILHRTTLGTYASKDWQPRLAKLRSELFSPDCWKLSIPAILYVIQNNLQYVAASNLDVATFQVTYQMKILTTAGFSVVMLGKKLSSAKWVALGCLALGVGIVQIQGQAASGGGGGGHASSVDMHPLKGFVAVTAACFTSGLAGVYFEKVLKGSQADLWVRNVQLSLFSLIPAVLPVLFNPSTNVRGGLVGYLTAPFDHFNFWAWMTVSIQVFGGLVTALVIKYSDNILKGFATSLSIVISFLVSVGFFGYAITPGFVLGSSTVLGATWMYNQPERKDGGGGGGGFKGKFGKDGGRGETRVPGSPVPSDAPIIGDFRKPPHSAPSSMVNLMNLLTSTLTPNASAHPTPHASGANSPQPPSSADFYNSSSGQGLSGSSTAPGGGSPNVLSSGYFTPAEGSRPVTPRLGAAWDGNSNKSGQGW